jgi:molybdenum cofactor biosynthesis enzyme MoaA
MQIKPQTMSIVVGSAACNARCPFCVSKMTPLNGMDNKADVINFRNWKQACTLAKNSGVTTILLTGKGEPTLFPSQITQVLSELQPYEFPIIELQTNAIPIADGKIDDGILRQWYNLGLRVIAISNVGIDADLNRRVYLPYKDAYIDLPAVIKRLHGLGFSIRLATVMIKGGIDTPEAVQQLLNFAANHNVEQTTIRPVTRAADNPREKRLKVVAEAQTAQEWVNENGITESDVLRIHEWIAKSGTLLRRLPHGAEVYDYDGQNICLTNCLTREPEQPEIRQLIYFPDGHIRYDWEKQGAIIL